MKVTRPVTAYSVALAFAFIAYTFGRCASAGNTIRLIAFRHPCALGRSSCLTCLSPPDNYIILFSMKMSIVKLHKLLRRFLYKMYNKINLDVLHLNLAWCISCTKPTPYRASAGLTIARRLCRFQGLFSAWILYEIYQYNRFHWSTRYRNRLCKFLRHW